MIVMQILNMIVFNINVACVRERESERKRKIWHKRAEFSFSIVEGQ